MDVVGTLGYLGQEIHFLDAERYAYKTGNSVCIYDTTKGPREMIWKMENGVSCVAACFESQSMVFAPSAAGCPLEVVNSADQQPRITLDNPIPAAVIYTAFNREGDKVFGITDITDHRLLVWSTGHIGPAGLLLNKPLDLNVKRVSVNPCGNNICLQGEGGVSLGALSEVMGHFSVKFTPIDLEQPPPGGPEEEEHSEEVSKAVNFALWLPQNRLLVGTGSGGVFVVRCDTKKARYLGRFSVPEKRGAGYKTGNLVPTCAALSVHHVIVGAGGFVYWFPVNLNAPDDETLSLSAPVQVSLVGDAACAMVMDQNYITLLVGTLSGEILKMPLDVPEIEKPEEDPLSPNLDMVNKVFLESVDAEQVGSDARQGVILCTSHLTIDVQKFSARSRSSLSMFITGSHSGCLRFWRYSSSVVDNMVTGGGIRRSTPRPLKSIFQMTLSPLSPDELPPAICGIELVQLPMKHAKLVVLATESGSVEVWTLDAQENEDDDAKESDDRAERRDVSLRLIEDDEGSCLVRVEARKVFHTKVFPCPVGSLVTYTSKMGEKSSLKLAMASPQDNRIFIMSLLTDDRISVLSGIDAFVQLEGGDRPASLCWAADTLYVFCENAVYLYSTKDTDTPVLSKRVAVGSEVSAGSLSLSLNKAVTLSASHRASIYALKGLNLDAVRPASLEHEDIVVVIAHAPSGMYFATGCVDGSLYVWKADADRDEFVLANQLKLHDAPLCALAFSSDSSLLLTCSVDGSCFIVTLDKPSTRRPGGIRASFMQEDGPQYLSELMPNGTPRALPPPSNSTWVEHKTAQKALELKAKHKFKAMGISAAVGEIAGRLKVLVAQNAERNELEVLERSEFVIDTQRRETKARDNQSRVDRTRDLYIQRNYCNELRAARVRAKCWDVMEIKGLSLLALSPSLSDADVRLLCVSSFSLMKHPPAYSQALGRVMRLRQMEVRAQRASSEGSVKRLSGSTFYRCAWASALTGCPLNIAWLSNDGSRWPVSDKVASLLETERVDDTKDKEGTTTGTGAGAGVLGGVGGKDAKPEVEVEDDEMSLTSMDEDFENNFDENNILNLLYPPQAVRTQVQKRNQVVLLKEAVRQIRLKFNEQFSKLRAEKEDIISAVESRNVRIGAILDELHQVESLFRPALANEEKVGSTVAVEEEELSTRPYESEAARGARLREEEEKARREAEKDKEDVKGRALDEMMHGSLEVRRDVLAEAAAFVKPEWIDQLTPNEMNEGQLKEYDAYQTKLKALQEEQGAYRRSLEQEMKKLKNEVIDVCKSFDEKLSDLSSLKVLVHREVFSHEIYISRLALNMAQTEQTWKFLRRSEEQVQELRVERGELRGNIDLLGAQLEEMKTAIGAIQEEERGLDKTFRRDLQNLCNTTFDQDYLKVLTGLYRRRTYPRGGQEGGDDGAYDQSEQDASASVSKANRRSKDGSSRGGKSNKGSQSKRVLGSSDVNKAKKMKGGGGVSKGGGVSQSKDGGMGPMQQAAQALRGEPETSHKDKDPYYEALLELEKQKTHQEAQIPLLTPLSIELDCPEGFDIDQFSWSKLTELRNARIEKEIEGKLLAIEFARLKQKLEHLDMEEGILAGCIADIKAGREAALTALKNLETNLELVVRLRQGQDEVDKDAVVTNYSDALLLPIEVISKYNTRIKELGREKIAVLTKIKQFRRKINLIDWQAKHHGLEARHYEAYLTDLQLFRVTRELQKVIRDGADAQLAKERLDKVTQRMDFQAHDAEAKLLSQRRNKETLLRALEDRRGECGHLEEKIGKLRSEVALAKSVKYARDQARGESGDAVGLAAAKMKKVVARRQQVDIARAQAEEIDYLRQELDKMRQRTFPSFVRATKKRLTSIAADL